MISGIYSAGSAMVAGEQRQQVVAENLANIDVPGFRRMIAPLEQISASGVNGPTTKSGVMMRSVARDPQPGVMEPTGNPLDAALEGDGYFVVDGPDGPLYTRAGVMHVDGQGRLVTTSGFPFRGLEPLPADVTPDQIQIGADGTVTARNQSLGQLELAQFADPQSLVPVGVVYFAAGRNAQPEPATAMIRQGVRERSNVNATEELIQMMVGMRHHEAAQKALRAISEAIQEHTRSR